MVNRYKVIYIKLKVTLSLQGHNTIPLKPKYERERTYDTSSQ